MGFVRGYRFSVELSIFLRKEPLLFTSILFRPPMAGGDFISAISYSRAVGTHLVVPGASACDISANGRSMVRPIRSCHWQEHDLGLDQTEQFEFAAELSMAARFRSLIDRNWTGETLDLNCVIP
jgi:hypothetical protein